MKKLFILLMVAISAKVFPSEKLLIWTKEGNYPKIEITNTDGTARRVLVDESFNPGYAKFSPNGRKIVFTGNKNGQSQIYVIDYNGGGSKLLANEGENVCPSWSPDGKMIVFCSKRGTYNNYEVFIMNEDGSNQQKITFDGKDKLSPVWSPDGKRIVYSKSVDPWAQELFSIKKDGTDEIRLTYLTNPYGGQHPYTSTPDWSPDGERIVFCSGPTWNYEIYIMDADDGGNLKKLTDTRNWGETFPIWSPRGDKIVYNISNINQYGNIYCIYTMSPDGSNKQILNIEGLSNTTPKGILDWSEILMYDLVVTDISFNPASPVEEGTLVDIWISVKNIGSITSPETTLNIYIGGDDASGTNPGGTSSIIPIGSLSVGEEIKTRATWQAKIGTHTIMARVDPDNKINELDETNNQLSKTMIVVLKRVNKVSAIYTWPNPARGNTINFRYKIEDNAEIEIGVYDLGLWPIAEFKKSSSSGYGEISWDIKDIPPGLYIYIFKARFPDGTTQIEKNRLVIIK